MGYKTQNGEMGYTFARQQLTGAFYVGLLDGLLGVAGMIITSDDMDHSRKFPAFSTRKTSLDL